MLASKSVGRRVFKHGLGEFKKVWKRAWFGEMARDEARLEIIIGQILQSLVNYVKKLIPISPEQRESLKYFIQKSDMIWLAFY